jgi:retinol dehydrogenase 12
MASYSEEDFLREQAQPIPAVITADLTGKTIIVTGANSGLGLEASKHFARMNPGRLIIVCRNLTKGEQAVTGKFTCSKKETRCDS